MRTFAVMVSAIFSLTVGGCSAPVAQSKAADAIILRHQRQEQLLCVPTVASMVLDHEGIQRTPRQLKLLALGDPNASEDAIHSITPYSDIVRVARSLGREWRQETYSNDEAGFEEGLSLIKAEIASGDPVIVDLSLARDVGHTVVVVGIDSQRGEITMIDPDRPAPGRRVFSLTEFRQIWNELSYGGDFRALIAT